MDKLITPERKGGQGRQLEKDRGMHVNKRNPYSNKSMRTGKWRRRGSTKKKGSTLMMGCTEQRENEKKLHGECRRHKNRREIKMNS